MSEPIRVVWRGVDGFEDEGYFASLTEAQAYAHKWAGEQPELGDVYATSADGAGSITADGASLADLFPKAG